MTSPQRVTSQKIDQAINIALSDYRNVTNAVQSFNGGKLTQPLLPTPIFKLGIATSTLSDLVNLIQSVSNCYGVLDVVQGVNGFDSMLTKPDSYSNGTIYFHKNQVMIESDLKLVAEIAESNLREEIAAFNANLIASDEAELKAIEMEELKEVQALRQAEIDKANRDKRKTELKSKLAA